MFAGQCMYFDPDFNIVLTPLYEEVKNGDSTALKPSGRLIKDTLCFHTFMLMNIINMVNCRVVAEHENNVFKTIFDNKWFWFIFILELVVQNSFILFGEV